MQFSYGQRTACEELRLPRVHRAPLGLHQDVELSAVCMRPAAAVLSEFLLSSVPLSAWADAWLLKAVFRNRDGLVHELTNVLRLQGIDVCESRWTLVDQGAVVYVVLLLDLTRYESEFDGDTARRTENSWIPLIGLNALITSRFARDLMFSTHAGPEFSIRRNQPLHRARALAGATSVLKIRSEGRLRLCELPCAASAAAGCLGSPEDVWYFVADGAHSALHLYRAPAHADVLHARFECSILSSAESRVANELRSRRFSLLQWYMRRASRSRYRIDVLLHWRRPAGVRHSAVDVLEQIAARLEPLNCRVTFPRSETVMTPPANSCPPGPGSIQ